MSAFIDVEYAQKRAGEGASGHSFWYDNSWVSSDLITALRYHLPPSERGLIRAEDGACHPQGGCVFQHVTPVEASYSQHFVPSLEDCGDIVLVQETALLEDAFGGPERVSQDTTGDLFRRQQSEVQEGVLSA